MATKTAKVESKQPREESEGKVFDDVRDSVHKVWLAGIGVLATAEREGSKVFQKFVEAGEEAEEKGRDRVRDARERASKRFDKVTEKVGGTFEDRVAGALERLGVPTRKEIRSLSRKIERLADKVDELTSADAK